MGDPTHTSVKAAEALLLPRVARACAWILRSSSSSVSATLLRRTSPPRCLLDGGLCSDECRSGVTLNAMPPCARRSRILLILHGQRTAERLSTHAEASCGTRRAQSASMRAPTRPAMASISEVLRRGPSDAMRWHWTAAEIAQARVRKSAVRRLEREVGRRSRLADQRSVGCVACRKSRLRRSAAASGAEPRESRRAHLARTQDVV